MKRIHALILLWLASACLCLAQKQVNAMVDIAGVAGTGTLPKPSYKSDASGVVVVKVLVNPDGTVAEAEPGHIGSTTDDKSLLQAAGEAARKARFQLAEDVSQPCSGTITFGFGVSLDPENVHGRGVDQDGFTFFVQEREDELLPVRLKQADDTEEMFLAVTSLPKGAPMEIMGSLSELLFDGTKLKALVDAEVLYTAIPIESDSTLVPPKFKGRDANSFASWVANRLEYPPSAKKHRITGTVIVAFTINEEGEVGNVKVVQSAHPALDGEAVRVVSMSPRWTPATRGGRPVPVTYRHPVIFHSLVN